MKLIRRVVAVGCVLVGVALGQGAKRAMTFGDLMAMKRVSDPQVSPGGKWVLFSVMDVSLTANTKVNHLWVVALQPPSENPAPSTGSGQAMGHPASERQLTFGPGETNGRFSPDGKFVSYTAAAGEQEPNSRIVLSGWDESAGKFKGNLLPLKRMTGDVDGAIWSPDSNRLLATLSVYPECSDRPRWDDEDACDKAKDEAATASPVKAQLWTSLLYRHWNAFTGLKRSHVLMIDLDGGIIRDLTPRSVVGDAETPTFSLGGPLGYAWAPDSKEISYVTNLDAVKAASTNNDVFTLRLDEAGARPVKVSTSLGSDDGPAYSPDGRWLAFRSQARAGYESDKFDLIMMNRASKKLSPLTSKFDGWVDEFTWSELDRIYFASPRSGGEWVMARNLMGQDAEDPRPISKAGEFSSLNTTQGDGQVIAVQMTAQQPSEVVSITTSSSGEGVVRRLTHLNDGLLTSLDLTKMESYEFTGAEGAKAQGFIVRPPNFDPKKKYPVKFLIHGGPQGAWGDAWSYRWNPELMAASGYVVVMVNPRGSTGYGQAFIDGVNGDWGGKAYEDLMKGLDAAEKQFPFIDKDRECALGASYGGFMANWMLTHTNRFKCIVTHDGMYNPAAAYGDTEEMWFNEWEFRRAGEKEPGQPWRYAAGPIENDPFRRWSPMLSIQNARTPTLVIHSQKDYRLDVSEGFQLFTALQRLNVPSEMLYFPDEGHWVTKPKNAELWNKTVSDWCDKWTKTGAYAGR